MEVDPETNELYIADGYTNLRVIVVDAEKGMYRRHWGAYGQNPVNDAPTPDYIENQPPSPNFANPVHGVRIANDGLVYVGDRVNNRIRCSTRRSRPAFVPRARTCGFLGDLPRDGHPRPRVDVGHRRVTRPGEEPLQRGRLEPVRLDLRRETDDILGPFGQDGRNAGHFHWVHNLAIDSKGNIYTAEVDTGKRVQKFTPTDDDRGRDKDDNDADSLEGLNRPVLRTRPAPHECRPFVSFAPGCRRGVLLSTPATAHDVPANPARVHPARG